MKFPHQSNQRSYFFSNGHKAAFHLNLVHMLMSENFSTSHPLTPFTHLYRPLFSPLMTVLLIPDPAIFARGKNVSGEELCMKYIILQIYWPLHLICRCYLPFGDYHSCIVPREVKLLQMEGIKGSFYAEHNRHI